MNKLSTRTSLLRVQTGMRAILCMSNANGGEIEKEKRMIRVYPLN